MADSSAIRAGKGYVELGLDRSTFTTGLRDAGKQFTDWGKKIATVGAGFATIGAAITGPLALAAKTFATLGSGLKDVSVKTGLSVETLSKLQFAAKRTGTDLGTVESGLGSMETFLQKVADGSGESTKQLDALGLSLNNLQGKTAAEQLDFIGRRIAAIKDPAAQAKAAVAIFGASGTQLLPLLGNLAALNQKAEALGLVMSTEDATAAKELSNSWSTLAYVTQYLKATIGSAVAGPLKDMADWTTNVIGSVNRWIGENRGLVTTLFRVGGAIAGIGTVLLTVGGALATVGAIMGGIATGIATAGTAAGAALAFLLSPLGILAVALTSAAGAWLYFSGLAGKAANGLSGAFGTLARDSVEAWNRISDAFARGDLQGAVAEAWKFIKLEFGNGIGLVKSAWYEFAAAVQTSAGTLGSRIKEAFQSFASSPWGQYFQSLAAKFGPVFKFLSEGFTTLRDDAATAFSGIAAALSKGDITAAAKILWLALRLEWARGTNLLTDLWTEFSFKFTTIATEAFYGIAEPFNNAWAGIKTAWVETVSFFKSTWYAFSDAILEAWDGIVFRVKSKMLELQALNPFADKAAVAKEALSLILEMSENKRARQESRSNRSDTRESDLAAIEAARVAANQNLPQQKADALAAARAAYEAAKATPGSDVAQAQADLAKAVADAKAATPKGKAGNDKTNTFAFPTTADVKKTGDSTQAVGTFNPFAIRALGSGVMDRIAVATEETAKNTKNSNKKAAFT